MPKTLDKKVRDLIEDRADAEFYLELAVGLIEWLTDSMEFEDRTSELLSWAAFNDGAVKENEGGSPKYGWKFLKDCGLLIGAEEAKTEYKFYKKGWFKR